ncbi:MAG TPA: hypothetical protein IAB02_10070 [Candidatus Pullichristensenella excrementigallinarum]|uniref:Uncharacterized protein n=1 Tax=Candidatus Pullichristensenella excrementigallinarum TaxID=2840907 RepID=A0A9D1ICV7_9FIRM|nr:hypothetical protein [Candidatus Pullichristensenella excrementigallinarum]
MTDQNTTPKSWEETVDPVAAKRKSWAGFIEDAAVTFFDSNNLEKMTLEDGTGNKAKLQRTKNNSIKIEYTSSVVL